MDREDKMNRRNGKERCREIYIDCMGDSSSEGYYLIVNGKIFGYFQNDEMVDFIIENTNGSCPSTNKLIFRKHNLSEEANNDIDSIKLGLEWKVNRRTAVKSKTI